MQGLQEGRDRRHLQKYACTFLVKNHLGTVSSCDQLMAVLRLVYNIQEFQFRIKFQCLFLFQPTRMCWL